MNPQHKIDAILPRPPARSATGLVVARRTTGDEARETVEALLQRQVEAIGRARVGDGEVQALAVVFVAVRGVRVVPGRVVAAAGDVDAYVVGAEEVQDFVGGGVADGWRGGVGAEDGGGAGLTGVVGGFEGEKGFGRDDVLVGC